MKILFCNIRGIGNSDFSITHKHILIFIVEPLISKLASHDDMVTDTIWWDIMPRVCSEGIFLGTGRGYLIFVFHNFCFLLRV
jgi:hypothetical protein